MFFRRIWNVPRSNYPLSTSPSPQISVSVLTFESVLKDYLENFPLSSIQYAPINFGVRLHNYKNKDIFNYTYV